MALPLPSTYWIPSTARTPACLLCRCWDLSSSPQAGKCFIPQAISPAHNILCLCPAPGTSVPLCHLMRAHSWLGTVCLKLWVQWVSNALVSSNVLMTKRRYTKTLQASPTRVGETDDQMVTRTLCFRGCICSQFLCEGFISVYYSGRQPSAATRLTVSLDRGQVARIFSGQFQQMFINTLREANSRQISNIGGGDESHSSSWKQES